MIIMIIITSTSETVVSKQMSNFTMLLNSIISRTVSAFVDFANIFVRFTNLRSKILTKFDLDSLNTSEDEWKLVRAFAQINLSLLIAYFSSMLSEMGHIILELGGCQGGH